MSVSESSHTESDSSPPMTVRHRCSGLPDVPRCPEETSSTPQRQQQEGIWVLLPPSGEGSSGAVTERPLERQLKLDEELPGQSSESCPGVAQRTVKYIGWSILQGGRLSHITGLIIHLGPQPQRHEAMGPHSWLRKLQPKPSVT